MIYIYNGEVCVCVFVTFLLILPSPKVFTPDDPPRPSRPKAGLGPCDDDDDDNDYDDGGKGDDDDEDLASGEVISVEVEEDDGRVKLSARGGRHPLEHNYNDAIW